MRVPPGLLAAVRNMVTRGKIALAAVGPTRTIATLRLLQAETKQGVECLFPFGMSANPDAGDVLAFQVLGTRDHVVAIMADNPALRIADLASGEFGFRDKWGNQITFRSDGIHIEAGPGLRLRMVGDVVERVALQKSREEVAGYAEEFAYDGGSTYTDTTWHLGATVNAVPNAVDPPEHFSS